MELKHVKMKNGGSVRAIDDDIQYGEITYSTLDNGDVSIDYTEVESRAKGQGVGQRLVEEIARIAREEDFKVVAKCPFARSVFEKNEELHDVLV